MPNTSAPSPKRRRDGGLSLLTLRAHPPGSGHGAATAVHLRLANPISRPRLIAAVTLREATLAEVGAWSAGEADEMALVCAMAGLAREEFAALSWCDAERIMKAVHFLLPDIGPVAAAA